MIPHATGLDAPVSFHNLKAYGRSGMHGYLSRTVEMRPTAAMLIGAGVDAMLFGHVPVVMYGGSVRRGKEWDAFAAQHQAAIILNANEYTKCCDMADAVRNSALAWPLMQGKYQQTKLFRWMGLNCRATPDVIGSDYLTELKTSQTSDPVRFPWQCIRMGYHAQLRMQNIAIGNTAQDHYIVCVESSAPYPVTVFRVSEQLLEQGEKLLVLWAEKLKQCEAAKHWGPYCESIVPIDAPEQEGDGLIFADDE